MMREDAFTASAPHYHFQPFDRQPLDTDVCEHMKIHSEDINIAFGLMSRLIPATTIFKPIDLIYIEII